MSESADEQPLAVPRAPTATRTDWAARWPIFGSHVQRLGLLRTVVGGGAMYLSFPLFLLFHLFGVALLQCVATPLLRLPPTPSRNYIVIDRHRIRGLPWLDRFNCAFCDYANGLCTLLNAKLDQLNAVAGRAGFARRTVVGTLAILVAPLLLAIQFFGVRVIYDQMVARSLGMRRMAPATARRHLAITEYGASWGLLARLALRHEKSFALRLDAALEQIESAWCPLRHLCPPRAVVCPAHHAHFLDGDRIEEMRGILQARGTVSRRA
jgi:hypothetical protein